MSAPPYASSYSGAETALPWRMPYAVCRPPPPVSSLQGCVQPVSLTRSNPVLFIVRSILLLLYEGLNNSITMIVLYVCVAPQSDYIVLLYCRSCGDINTETTKNEKRKHDPTLQVVLIVTYHY